MTAPVDDAHEVALDGPGGLVEAAVPFIEEGLAAAATVVTVCGEELTGRLARELSAGPALLFLPQRQVYRDVETAIGAYRELLHEHGRGGPVRVVGEVDFGASAGRMELAMFEAAVATTSGWLSARTLCLYDRRCHSPEALFVGEASHAYLRVGGERRPNPAYRAPADLLDARPGHDPVDAAAPVLTVPDVVSTAELRSAVRQALSTPGTRRERVEAFVLAVHESVANGLSHGSGPVSLRLWVSGRRVVCTVTDRGPGPERHALGTGVGLSLVRDLVDEVTTDRGPEGFTVRLAGDL